MKAHQRLIRERAELTPEVDDGLKRTLAASMRMAVVREITYAMAKPLIMKYEWLGNMGTTEYAYGLYFGEYLAGVVCFGRTGGTNVKASVAGKENAKYAITLCRGACVHWAHPHSASFLINAACREMTKRGYHIFIAYSDTEAGEIGTVYQASNWLYCGKTHPTEKFRRPDGRVQDSRLISAYCRDRRGHIVGTPMKYKCSRADMKNKLLAEGCVFFKGLAKHRYVGLYGNKRIVRALRKALQWQVLPYPKRAAQQSEVTPRVPPLVAGFDPPVPLQTFRLVGCEG